jgi:hypothetical protein
MQRQDQTLTNEYHELLLLVERNDVASLKEKIFSVDLFFSHLDIQHRFKRSLLDWASFLDHQSILDYVYSKIDELCSRNPSYLHYEILQYAIDCKQPMETIKDLYSQLDSPHILIQSRLSNGELLRLAIHRGYLKAVTFLIEKGSKINENYFLGYSSWCTPIHETPLYTAAAAGHVDIVKYLLALGADVNKFSGSSTPLRIASVQGHVEIMKLLLNKIMDDYAYSQRPHLKFSMFHAWYDADLENIFFIRKIMDGSETDYFKIKKFVADLDDRYQSRFRELARMSDAMTKQCDHSLLQICEQIKPYLYNYLDKFGPKIENINIKLNLPQHHMQLK